MQFRELGSTDPDLELLARFYGGLYCQEFPDPHERESHANMITYLRGAGAENCKYRIVLILDGDQPIGGAVTDYFVPSNTGVIEFLVIAPQHRRRGLGTSFLRDVEGRMSGDAEQRGRQIEFVAAEINDPFRRSDTPDNMDPFRRAKWWGDRDYGKLDFPYVQPALSEDQEPVRNLALCARLIASAHATTVRADLVDAFVRDYLVYAMRIENPFSSADYVRMAGWLGARSEVGIVPLHAYVGDDSHRTLRIARFADRKDQFWHHVWTIEVGARERNCTTLSFFTLSQAGFCGRFDAESLPADHLRTIVARVERQMIADSGVARGWYVDCQDESTASALRTCGFYDVARALPGMRLLYKEFGAQYAAPSVDAQTFAAVMREVNQFVPDSGFAWAAKLAADWQTVPFR